MASNSLEHIWQQRHNQLKWKAVCYILVVSVLFIVLVFAMPVLIIFLEVLYLVSVYFYRQSFWGADQYIAKKFGYYDAMGFLWLNAEVLNWKAWFLMWGLWTFLPVPMYRCRIRSLKIWKGEK